MFTTLYFLDLGTVLPALPLWLISGYLTGRLRTARALRGFRVAAWMALVTALAAGLLGVLNVVFIVGGAIAFGPRVMGPRVYVLLPIMTAALLAVVRYGIPGLWRAARTAGQPRDAVPGAVARAAAEPRMVVPVRINAVAVGVFFYAEWFAPPVEPWVGAALVWWTPLAVVAMALWARQVRRRDGAPARRGALGRLVRGTAGLAVVAVVVTGCSVWSANSSRLAGVHSLDGGPHGHGSAATVARPISVDDLTERNLSGPVRRVTLTARTAKVRLQSGRLADAWTFNGQVPGPEIRVRQGDLVEATLVNTDIKAGVTLHWHGYDVPNAADGAAGVTQDAVPPGRSFVYRFRARDAGTYWYHSHQQSAEQVRRGLFGSLIVEPGPAATTKGRVDLPVLFHRWDQAAVPGRARTFGLAEGRQHRQVAPGTPVRLRLINTDNHPLDLSLAGTAFRVAAIDGGEVTGPGELRAVTLPVAGGGRYDLTFAMPNNPVELRAAGPARVGLPSLVLSPDGQGTLAAEPGDGSERTFDPAGYGTSAAAPYGPGTRYDRHFTLAIDNSFGFFDGRLVMRFRVNGRVFPDVPPLVVRQGEVIETTFINRSYDHHPMHLHGHHMLVLSRNGRAVTGSPWWTDTLNVAPGETINVAIKADNPGVWMDHCHNLDHAATGMTLHLTYDGVTSRYRTGRATPNHPE